jgi:hypothetical protein
VQCMGSVGREPVTSRFWGECRGPPDACTVEAKDAEKEQARADAQRLISVTAPTSQRAIGPNAELLQLPSMGASTKHAATAAWMVVSVSAATSQRSPDHPAEQEQMRLLPLGVQVAPF